LRNQEIRFEKTTEQVVLRRHRPPRVCESLKFWWS